MKTRTNKFRGKRIWLVLTRLFKAAIKDIFYLLVALIYLILKTYIELEKAFRKVFKLLPLWIKRVIILTLIINVVILSNKDAEIIEKVKKIQEVKEVYVVKETYKEKDKCSYGIYECAIYDEAVEIGLTDKQAKIAIAISKHETGSYTSYLFKNNNNVGGLYNGASRKFYSYNSIEDGIIAYLTNLKKGYFDKGLDTIEKIQKKYAPTNAANDPTGLNNNWVSGVTYFYNEIA